MAEWTLILLFEIDNELKHSSVAVNQKIGFAFFPVLQGNTMKTSNDKNNHKNFAPKFPGCKNWEKEYPP